MRWKYGAAVLMLLLLVSAGIVIYVRYFIAAPILQPVIVGGVPMGVALDEGTGKAFVTTDLSSNLVVLDTRRGAVIRKIALQGEATNQPNVDEQAGWVIVNTSDGKARIYSAQTGQLLFTTPQLDPNGTVTDTGLGHVFSMTQGGVLMLDLHSGRVLYRLQTQASGLLALVPATARVFVTSGGNGDSADPGTVLMLDAHTGKLLRAIGVGKGAWDVQVDPQSNHVFVAAQGNNVITTLDGRTGNVIRTVHLGAAAGLASGTITASGVLALDWGTPDGQGQFTRPGNLDVLDAVTGRLLHSIPVGIRPDAVVLDKSHNRLFVANWGTSLAGTNAPQGNGTVSVIDGSSFRVIRTTAVGYNPQRIYVDKQAGRIYVFNMGTFSASANVGLSSLSVLDGDSGILRRTVPLGSGGIQLEHDSVTGKVIIIAGTDSSAVSTPADQVPDWLRRLAPWLLQPKANTCDRTGCVTILDTTRL